MNLNGELILSVIIPFMDNHEEVLQIKEYLDKQTYPQDLTEVIFVDNGSKRKIPFPEEFENEVTLIHEYAYQNSPYSARNRGIEIARGDVIVLLDANSRPVPGWLEEGLNCMKQTDGSIIAGCVHFDIGDKPGSANIVDALTSVNMKKAVEERKVAYTANLFIQRKVLEDVGLFEEGTRSGGDVRWSMNAIEKGYRISYCERALVYKFPRSFFALLRKKLRTGRGYFYTWKNEKDKPIWFYNFFRSLKPPSLGKWNTDPVRSELIARGNKLTIWLTLYFIGIAEQFSFIIEYIRYNLGKQRDIDRRKEILKDNSGGKT